MSPPPRGETMATTLAEHLADSAAPELAAAVGALAEAAAGVARMLAGPGAVTAGAAEAAIAAWLPGAGVRWLASRDRGGVTAIDARGGLALSLDPLDGAASAAAGGPAGMLFALRPALPGAPEASFLRPGAELAAAGCVLYGPHTRLALALGGAAAAFTLNPAAAFHRAGPAPRIPEAAAEFAANIAHYRHWDRPVQRYVDDCLAGADGPRAADHDLRWTGCLAAELHRILARGGLFLAPRGAPDLPGLVHQAQPLAFIAEAAGGRATDGQSRLLDAAATALDSASALVFGSDGPVAQVAAYHDLPDSETSPLFGQRGLFRL